MIFVSVGTTGFDKLIMQVDTLASHSSTEFIVQIGPGIYEPQHCTFFRYKASLLDYYQCADVIVSHGGLATVTEVLQLGRRLVAVEDTQQPDRHQQEILNIWSQEGHLLWCKNLETLENCIQVALTTSFKPYGVPVCNIHTVITEYIDQLVR